jgi:3-dehydroquinate dehydratase-2
VYGRLTLADLEERLHELAAAWGVTLRSRQSNSEGALIDALHEARAWADGVIFNPGGYTHTSVALRDAVAAVEIPVIEVHLSNVAARESFRRRSLIGPVCAGGVAGFGWRSYAAALFILAGESAWSGG